MVRRHLIVNGIVEEAGCGRRRPTMPGVEQFALGQEPGTGVSSGVSR